MQKAMRAIEMLMVWVRSRLVLFRMAWVQELPYPEPEAVINMLLPSCRALLLPSCVPACQQGRWVAQDNEASGVTFAARKV
eukprot:718287-Pelagomonas_calceolata.AAC.2